ncbi:recombinase RecB [Curtobacterium sp. MCPF17_051]|nr:recombinase RecB [Curtobacterium sp. MCPF17_051]
MHVIGYVRVSTEEQERSGLGVEAQVEAIHAEASRRGWTVEVVADLGRSGKAVNPELRRALDLLRTGQAEALVVAKIDRLARSVLHASEILVAAQQQHWNLVILDLAVDLATPQGRAMAQMLATFAELEREMISVRTKDALAARARRGERNGRPSAIPAGLMRRIVLSRDAGASFRSIATELTDEQYLTPTGLTTWSESVVRRAYNSIARVGAVA